MVTRKIYMSHCMIDLETVGNQPGCGILSIGAVLFNPASGNVGSEFYRVIRRQSCLDAGLFEQTDTLDWWHRQSIEAQEVLLQASKNTGTLDLAKALVQFTEFLKPASSNVKIWGCGSDFDNVILATAYQAVDQALPWKFWNNRCYRTVKSLAPLVKKIGRASC